MADPGESPNGLWHDGPLDALGSDPARPVAWSLRLDTQMAASMATRAPLRSADLSDLAGGADAAARLLRRRLLKALVAQFTGVHATSVVVARSAEGRPSLAYPEGWHISLSGRYPFCLIGIAAVPIGVDVEPLTNEEPLWDMLGASETRHFLNLPEDDRGPEWLRRWAAKEAHLKLIGWTRVDPRHVQTEAAGQSRLSCSFQGRSLCRTRQFEGRIEAVALMAKKRVASHVRSSAGDVRSLNIGSRSATTNVPAGSGGLARGSS